MDLLTPEQQNRFEAFRRSSLARRNMKRVRGCNGLGFSSLELAT